jgi:hypothetical protein
VDGTVKNPGPQRELALMPVSISKQPEVVARNGTNGQKNRTCSDLSD